MTMVSTAEIAKIFNEIRDQRDAANKRAEAAEARAAQAEAERDEAWRELYYEQHRNDFLERRVRELTRQNLQEYEAETPLGQQLDGGGDEVEQ